MKNVPEMIQKMIHCESWKRKLVESDPLEEMLQEVEVVQKQSAWIVKMTEGRCWCQMLPSLLFLFFDIPLLVQCTQG